MLARTYKSAVELGRTQPELDALMLALDYLGKSDIPVWTGDGNYEDPPPGDSFDMRIHVHEHRCGTVACLAGYAHILSNRKVFDVKWITTFMNQQFRQLGHRDLELAYLFSGGWQTRGVPEACTALHDYLTTGETRWDGKRYFENEMFKRQMDNASNGARFLLPTGD
jgi:hypothetical protein